MWAPGLERLFIGASIFLLLPWLALCAAIGCLRCWCICEPTETLWRLAAATCRRWMRFLVSGLQPLREVWWGEMAMERPGAIGHYLVLLELFNLMNVAAGAPRRAASSPRVLALKLAHFGDALHITPALRGLRDQTKAEIDLLVGPWCDWLARRIPMVRERLVYAPRLELFTRGEDRGRRSLAGDFAFMWSLRRRRYDIVFSTSTTRIVELCLIHAVGAPVWVGASSDMYLYPGPFRERTAPYETRRYEADRIGSLLTLLGLEPVTGGPEYSVTEDERKEALDLLSGLGLAHGAPFVVVSPGAGWPGKQWPAERFSALADFAAERTHATIVLAGAPSERDLVEDVARGMKKPSLNIAGRTSIPQLAALLEKSMLFIGNDSGPMHLAAALGVPSIVLFGPTRAEQWAPRGPHQAVLQARSDCDGCWYWHPKAHCVHDGRCMNAITLEQARDAVQAIVARPPASLHNSGKATTHDRT